MSTFFQLILNWCVSTTQWSHTLVDEGSLIQGGCWKATRSQTHSGTSTQLWRFILLSDDYRVLRLTCSLTGKCTYFISFIFNFFQALTRSFLKHSYLSCFFCLFLFTVTCIHNRKQIGPLQNLHVLS